MLKLPWDLFSFTLELDDDWVTDNFIQFAIDIANKEGHYFNKHFMHKYPWFSYIQFTLFVASKLYSYSDIFKSIRVANDSYRREWEIKSENLTLFDKLSLEDDSFLGENIKTTILRSSNENEQTQSSNQADVHIHRVHNIYLYGFSNEKLLTILKDIGELKTQIDNIYLSVSDPDESEILTNPEFFEGGLEKIYYSFKKSHTLSNIFFQNVNKINLRSISFMFEFRQELSYDIIRVLSYIKQDIELTFEYSFPDNDCQLLFVNAPIKIIQSNCKEPIYLKWKDFSCYIDLNEFENHFWFTSELIDTNGKAETYIHIVSSKEYCFNRFIIIDDIEEIKKNDQDSSKNLLNDKIETEIIVSTKYLNTTNIGKGFLDQIKCQINKRDMMQELSKAKLLAISLNYSLELKYIDQLESLFPPKWTYLLFEHSQPITFEEFELQLIKPLKDNILSFLSNLKIPMIYFDFVLSEAHYSFICDILLLQSIQKSLKFWHLNLENLTSALEVLLLLSDWIYIENVELTFNYFDDTPDPEHSIRMAKKAFTKKVGIISELIINSNEQYI